MHIWLTNFLRKNKVRLSYQFVFRNNYSTNHTQPHRNYKKCSWQWQLCLWCLHRSAESLWHYQWWYSSFQTKPLQDQRSSFWFVQKLSQWQNTWELSLQPSIMKDLKSKLYGVSQGSISGALLKSINKKFENTTLCW